ncbi:hypothetical protein ERJ75_000899600 [Trypanosoma vivax]|nr:hypothetical protein ERJ75_000899600 [Trypanosoma vivax]
MRGQGGVGGVKGLGETALAGWVPEVKALAGEGKQGKSYANGFFALVHFFLLRHRWRRWQRTRGREATPQSFAVLCGAYREAKAVKDSAEQMRERIESFAAVGREGHVVEETGGPGSGDGIGTQPSRRQRATQEPRAVADDLAKMARATRCRRFTAASRGSEQKVPDAEDATNGCSRCCAARRPQPRI